MTTSAAELHLGTKELDGAPRGRFLTRELTMALALWAIWAVFAVQNPAFLGARNLSNLAVELSITAVLSLGMLLIILPGQIDLSVGSGVGLFGGLVAVLMFNHDWPAPLAMLVTVALAVAVWMGMGALIIRQRIPAFIITLAGLLVFKGLHWKVIQNATVPIQVGGNANLVSLLTTWFVPPVAGLVAAGVIVAVAGYAAFGARARRREFGLPVEPLDVAVGRLIITAQVILLFVLICNQFRGVPLSAVILAGVGLGVWVLSQRTRFGRYLYAIGGNEEAAVVSGVPVVRVVIGAFAIMGMLTALGGFMQTAYAGASTTTIGQLLELDAIAACVIGGTSLKGGRGTVLGVLFGSLIMASLLNGMNLLAVSPEFKFIVRGVVLAIAVWLDMRVTAKAETV